MTPLASSVTDLLTIAIVLVSMLMVVLDYRYFRVGRPPWKWLALVCMVTGVYWTVYYTTVLFLPDNQVAWTGPIFARPGLLITIGALTMIAIIWNKQK
jgi:hypothetical protein